MIFLISTTNKYTNHLKTHSTFNFLKNYTINKTERNEALNDKNFNINTLGK